MEGGLRASADRDLADVAASLRAQGHLIQALAITQGQHTETLRRHDEKLDLIGTQLDRIIGLLNRLIEDER